MVTRRDPELAVVDRFLRTGKASPDSIPEIVGLCDRQVRSATQRSAVESLTLGRRFVERCRKLDAASLLVALRATGWACLVAGKYTEARTCYLEARTLAIRQPLARARIDRTLIDVFMYLGDMAHARSFASRAFATFRKLKAEDDLARTNVNYANVLHRQDRHREAYTYYHRASEHFHNKGDELSAALCWYNEANTLVQLFDFDSALKLYTDARTIFQKKHHELHAYSCLYGLAWLRMLKGDFHVALRDLAECEKFYRAGGQQRELTLCLLDRAESYLGLNLLADAGRAAAQARVGARKLGIKYEEAKAVFFSTRALLGMGQDRRARLQLGVARRLMESEGNKGFLAAITVTQALLGRSAGQRQREFDRARTRLRSVQLPLWEAICDVEIAADQSDKTAALRRLRKSRAVQTVPHLLAQYGVLRGDAAAARGKNAEATRWWTQSAEVLDAVRAVLPPIEVRSAYLSGRRDPFHRLIKAELAGNAQHAAVWVERSKTVGIWSPLDLALAENPARVRVQRSMAELAQQVSAVALVTANSGGRRSGRSSYSLPVMNRLREAVRQELLSLYAEGPFEGDSPRFTRELLGSASEDLPIVQFHVGEQDIEAFVSYRGECRARTYVDGVRTLEDFVARWRFFVESAPSNANRHRAVDLSDETGLIARMRAWLLKPLNLPVRADRILVIPDDRLFCLPWPALDRSGEELGQESRLILSPSVRHYLHSCRPMVSTNKACIFVGDSAGLPWLREEVDAIKKRLGGLSLDRFEPCRRRDWPDSSTAKLWHFAGHATLRSDNPFYSALLLGNEQIFAADFRLMKNDVGVVTLAACRTGQQTGLPGEETSGLVRALLEMGARSVVAGGWAVADRSTTLWMESFYSALVTGKSPLTAMGEAITAVRKEYPSAFHWAAFSVYGAG